MNFSYQCCIFGPGLQVLTDLVRHILKCEELYIRVLSVVYLLSVFGGYTDTDMQMRGPPAEIASFHQHTECVYFVNPNIIIIFIIFI